VCAGTYRTSPLAQISKNFTRISGSSGIFEAFALGVIRDRIAGADGRLAFAGSLDGGTDVGDDVAGEFMSETV